MIRERTREASLEQTEHGLRPQGEGWYVLNAADAEWRNNEKFGHYCGFEGDHRFEQLGVNLRILHPGTPGCHYHRESEQENFLVLSGECLLIVEGEERRLKAWDFVHCPPGTNHVFVGAGDGPCVVLMMGARSQDAELFYPKSELAAKYGASAAEDTPDPKVSYAHVPRHQPCSSPWPLA